MTGFIKKVYLSAAVISVVVPASMGLDNPLKTPVDGALIQYDGLYYGMSSETNGLMLASDNLVDWHSPVPVLSDQVPGPHELVYQNGLFFLYADRQGYAVSGQPDGGFSDIKKGGLSGDQMKMTRAADGTLFSVNRRAGKKQEGEIYLQRYSTPWKLYGEPKKLLDGRQGLWDSVDSANLGRPEILAHRGTWYLLYAANHPGPRTGLREIGVAMNENPLKFKNDDKLTDTVLQRNAERFAREYETILPSGQFGSWTARYTVRQPEGDWTVPDYRYSKWRTGKGGFGYPDELDGASLHSCRTKWRDERIWIRREFDLYRGVPATPVLNIRHEGPVQVFINGRKVYEAEEASPSYSNIDISEAAAGLLRPESNVMAVQSASPANADVRFIDFGLYDAGGKAVEATVCSLDAPRIITGPNGFEKWITYQAWWNGKKGSGLDRVFFFDKELLVDGPTTTNTAGYHPPPAMPTFSDRFTESEENGSWTNRWVSREGEWAQIEGAMRQSQVRGRARAYLKQGSFGNYLFETDIRFPDSGKGKAGVIAWSNGQQDLIISINPSDRTWSYTVLPGSLAPKRFKLPKTFRLLDVPKGTNVQISRPRHRLKVTKNGGYFEVYLNGVNLLPGKPIITSLTGPGVPGFYCNGAAVEFDNVIYTVGWDEYDEYITGWGLGHDGTSFGGEWKMDKELGLQQRKFSETGRAFKGDLLDQYEFCVTAQLEELRDVKDKTYGIFPVFSDKDNYVKVLIDTRTRKLIVSGKLGGKEIKPVQKSLRTEVEHSFLYDKNTPHRDIISWIYKLRSQSVISAFDVLWFEGDSKHLEQEFFVPSDDMDIRFAKVGRERIIKPTDYLWEESRFKEADIPKPKTQLSGIFNHIDLREEDANYLGFGIYSGGGAYVIDISTGRYKRDYKEGDELYPGEDVVYGGMNESDTPSRPLKTFISVEVESSYFFRCVKLKDQVIIELNGRPMVELPGRWPPSQVGLITEGQPAYFNGISLHHLPE